MEIVFVLFGLSWRPDTARIRFYRRILPAVGASNVVEPVKARAAGEEFIGQRRSTVAIMRLLLIALALVVPAIGTSGALAQTSHQLALTKFAAKIVYAENRCPHLKANTVGLVRLGKAHDISVSDWRPGGRFRQLLEGHVAALKAEHDSTNNILFCGVMEAHYGPNGLTAPGAMMLE